MKKITDIRNSKRMKVVDANISQLEHELSYERQRRASLLGSQKIKCPHCSKAARIDRLPIIKGYVYRPSYSPCDEPEWREDGKNYTVCPACSELLQLQDIDWVIAFHIYFARDNRYRDLQLRSWTRVEYDHIDRRGSISAWAKVHPYLEQLIPVGDIFKTLTLLPQRLN